MRSIRFAPVLAIVLLAGSLEAQTLRGGQASLDRQNEQARLHDFSYLQTPDDVARMVELGYLVPVVPTDDLAIHNVSFPYARPEVRVFLHRLSEQYRGRCGEALVVTSLTRPISTQPRNASTRSVHPTGMAVDLRRPANDQCRSWLESTLLSLEGRGVIEAIYERNPPHYHLAVYPDPYIQYVAEITGNERIVEEVAATTAVEVEWITHTVRSGENLTLIANRYGAATARIQAENGLNGTRINVGQSLRIPIYHAQPVRMAEAPTPAPAPVADEAPDLEDNGSAGAGMEEAPADTPSELTHQVRSGESLWILSRRYGVSEADIRRANSMTGTQLRVGEELRIPMNGNASGPILHEVRPGESLWAIANLHQTSVAAIRDANGLGSGTIQPGQVLEVPSSR